jgi:hypothetical protein
VEATVAASMIENRVGATVVVAADMISSKEVAMGSNKAEAMVAVGVVEEEDMINKAVAMDNNRAEATVAVGWGGGGGRGYDQQQGSGYGQQ